MIFLTLLLAVLKKVGSDSHTRPKRTSSDINKFPIVLILTPRTCPKWQCILKQNTSFFWILYAQEFLLTKR